MKNRIPKNISKDQQLKELKAIQELKFFENNHFLDARLFCSWLARALDLDGFYIQSPDGLFQLLVKYLTKENVAEGKVREDYIKATFRDEDLDFASHIYPDYYALYIHISLFPIFAHDFIATVGEEVLNIKPLDKAPIYSYWLTRDDIYTCEYFSALFRNFTEIAFPFMKKGLMAFHLQRNDINCSEDLSEIIKAKEERHCAIKMRVDKAIEHEFYLEAIALQESLISDRLSFILYSENQEPKSRSFRELIRDCSKYLSKTLETNINEWRKNRNLTIHELVRSSPLDEQITLEELDVVVKKTALTGVLLVEDLDVVFNDFFMTEKNFYYFRLSNEEQDDTVVH